MKTNEIEKKTGLSKQTILYYEKEDLLQPKRDQNGYRHYTDNDVQILLLIKLLRSMNINIDDIRLVLQNQISFQECLETQNEFIEESLNTIQDIQKNINFFKNKHVPLIPAFQDIEKIDSKIYFGFYKSTPNVSIGRKLTAKLLKKKIALHFFYSIILALAVFTGYMLIYHQFSILVWILSFLFFFLYGIIMFGFGIGKVDTIFSNQDISQFIEFDEEGISYHLKGTFKEQMSYAKDILSHQDHLKHISYDQIKFAKIKHVQRFMRIPGTNLPSYIDTIDFQLEFDNGDKLYFINPIILDNDLQLIRIILKDKVKNFIEIDYQNNN